MNEKWLDVTVLSLSLKVPEHGDDDFFFQTLVFRTEHGEGVLSALTLSPSSHMLSAHCSQCFPGPLWLVPAVVQVTVQMAQFLSSSDTLDRMIPFRTAVVGQLLVDGCVCSCLELKKGRSQSSVFFEHVGTNV